MSHLEKNKYNSINELCPNCKDVRDDNKYIYLLNSDGPIVMVVTIIFYFASVTHSSVHIS